jgi:hypothetical protein
MTVHRCQSRTVTFGTTDVIPDPKYNTANTILLLPSAADDHTQTVSSRAKHENMDNEVWNDDASTMNHRRHAGQVRIYSDAGSAEFWKRKRKLEMQSILLQQDIHRALHIDEPIAIAKLAAAYSMNARIHALQRGIMVMEEVKQDADEIDCASRSSCDSVDSGPNDCLPVQSDGRPLYSSFLIGRHHPHVANGEHVDTKGQENAALWGVVLNEL